jgi:hypothetical protein
MSDGHLGHALFRPLCELQGPRSPVARPPLSWCVGTDSRAARRRASRPPHTYTRRSCLSASQPCLVTSPEASEIGSRLTGATRTGLRLEEQSRKAARTLRALKQPKFVFSKPGMFFLNYCLRCFLIMFDHTFFKKIIIDIIIICFINKFFKYNL